MKLTKLVNLTEHPVRLVNEEENGGVVFIPASGKVVRVETLNTPNTFLNISTEGGIIIAPVMQREVQPTTPVPAPEPNTVFIVSVEVLEAYPERTDFVIPDTSPDSIIEKDGEVIAVRRFTSRLLVNPILAAMERVLRASIADKIEFACINPKSDLGELIEKNGGVVQSDVFHRTCHGGRTCACNSHPEGFYEMQVAVPFAWTLGCDEYSADYVNPVNLFKDVEERDELLFIIPDKETGPRAVVKRHYEHPWFPDTRPLHQQHRFAPGYFSSWTAKYHTRQVRHRDGGLPAMSI